MTDKIDFSTVTNVTRAKNYVGNFNTFLDFIESGFLHIPKENNLELTLHLIAWVLLGRDPVEATTTFSMNHPYDKIFKSDKTFYDTCYTICAHLLYVLQFKTIDMKDVRELLYAISFTPGHQLIFYQFIYVIGDYVEDYGKIERFVGVKSDGRIINKSIEPWMKNKIPVRSNMELIVEMFTDLGEEFSTNNLEDLELVCSKSNNSNMTADNFEMFDETFGMCYIYNKVVKNELSNWPEGYNAYRKLPKIKALYYEAAFRRIAELRNGSSKFFDAKSEIEVTRLITDFKRRSKDEK
jgi:hypothetical protein